MHAIDVLQNNSIKVVEFIINRPLQPKLCFYHPAVEDWSYTELYQMMSNICLAAVLALALAWHIHVSPFWLNCKL